MVITPHFVHTHIVRVQMTFDVGGISMPEPDLLVISREDAAKCAYPTTAELIIEVANTSLAYDRREKMSIYARARVPDYWILNVVDRQLEVHRDPHPNRKAFVGHAYRSVQILRESDVVSALSLPRVYFSIAEMLGP